MLSPDAAFIMPIRCTGRNYELPLLKKVMSAIFTQSDNNWLLIIVDDNSTCERAKLYLEKLNFLHPNKIKVNTMEKHKGPGYCRNVAIEMAANFGISIIMYIDSDDIPHPRRVEITRSVFAEQKFPVILYSPFIPVDEKSKKLYESQLTPSLMEIMQAHNNNPLQGYDVWKDIGCTTGYLNLTSSTSVSTELALLHPFPHEMVSEDSHTWMRYSAGGGFFIFNRDIPVQYRVTTDEYGSSSRLRHRDNFYEEKARVDEKGFRESIKIALEREAIKPSDINPLLVKFYIRLSETLIKEEAFFAADHLIQKAFVINPNFTEQIIQNNPVVAMYTQSRKEISKGSKK